MIKANITIDIKKNSTTAITGWNTNDAQGKIFLDSVKDFVNAHRESNAMPNMDIFSVDETLYINTFQAQGTRDIIGFLSVDTQAVLAIEHSHLVKVHHI